MNLVFIYKLDCISINNQKIQICVSDTQNLNNLLAFNFKSGCELISKKGNLFFLCFFANISKINLWSCRDILHHYKTNHIILVTFSHYFLEKKWKGGYIIMSLGLQINSWQSSIKLKWVIEHSFTKHVTLTRRDLEFNRVSFC